jgi:hypothetical protein
MRLETPKDVREFVKEFIVKVGSGELEGVSNPGVIIQALNVWLKSYQIEREEVIEKRLDKLEQKIKEIHYEKRERELE